jgi:gluconokinase
MEMLRLIMIRPVLCCPGSQEYEARAARLEPDRHGLTVLPFLSGERAPGWNSDAKVWSLAAACA